MDKLIPTPEMLVCSALRYALGRHSYIVNVTAEFIIKELDNLTVPCKRVMLDDLETHIITWAKYDSGDHVELWKKLQSKIKESLGPV